MKHFSHTNKKGFTLIELLVVVAIIGLLSSVVLGSLSSARTKAKVAKTQTELRQIRIALEEYNNEYGGYPYPGSGLYCLGGTCSLAGVSGIVLDTISFKQNSQQTSNNLAAVSIPDFGDQETITIDGLTYSGYVYVTSTCTNPTASNSAFSGYVCPGNSGDTDVSIITPVGNNVETAGAATNFALTSYPTNNGSDGGSDGGSGGGNTDSDGDGIADSYPDNCLYTYNPDQADYNYNYVGDACEGSI